MIFVQRTLSRDFNFFIIFISWIMSHVQALKTGLGTLPFHALKLMKPCLQQGWDFFPPQGKKGNSMGGRDHPHINPAFKTQ